MGLVALAKDWLPPAVTRALAPVSARIDRRGNRVSGRYASWGDALRDSQGYDSDEIAARVAASTAAVVKGEAAFERDSVLFDAPQAHWPTAVAVLRAALHAGAGRPLHVLDFGGSLGSSYYQNRFLWTGVADPRWWIVEQPRLVERAPDVLPADGPVRVVGSIDEAESASGAPFALVVLSAVLQYLEEPYAVLDRLLALDAPYLLLDRIPLTGESRLMVQHVPADIYPVSYPVWFLSRRELESALDARGYAIEYEFESIGGWWVDGARVEESGLFIRQAEP